MSDIPNPGTGDAVRIGCTCPVIDNHHGAGYRGQAGLFVYMAGCPVHLPLVTDVSPRLGVRVQRDQTPRVPAENDPVGGAGGFDWAPEAA
jgi:hypothetical protein